MKRIAAPMVGAMVSSTVLTLLVIPAIYSLWKERQHFHHSLESVRSPRAFPTGERTASRTSPRARIVCA